MKSKKKPKAQKNAVKKKTPEDNAIESLTKDDSVDLKKNHNYRRWGGLIVLEIISIVIFIYYQKVFGYPLSDSFFIVSALMFFCLYLGSKLGVLSKVSSNKDKSRKFNVNVFLTFVFGIIALQAAWPTFMPRISLEDTSQNVGIYDGRINEYQISRDAIIRVKPPLFPIPPHTNIKTYRIASNLKDVDYDNSTPNLKIIRYDNENIQIELNYVTGWSFDEITGKIKYQSDKPFDFIMNDKNISNIRETINLEESDLFPYDYRHERIEIANPNNFPIEINNLSFSIYNNTNAWNSLKKWVDDGFCIFTLYSEQFDYRLSHSRAYINQDPIDINEKMFNSPYISIQVDLYLAPKERKFIDIVFKETICKTEVEKNLSVPPIQPHPIAGRISAIEDYPLIMLIKNVNRTKTDIIYTEHVTNVSYPDRRYIYEYTYDLPNYPYGYSQGDIIQVSVCKNAQQCILSKNITIDLKKTDEDLYFNLP